MSTIENPFSAPLTDDLAGPLTGSVDQTEAERIRREHIQHEVSVKSIGWLYYLSTFGLGLATFGMLATAYEAPDPTVAYVMAAIFLFFAVVFAAVGHGMRTLASWSKVPVIILSALNLISFPLGTLIGGYILYLVLCQKGRMVLSPEYKEIIRQTPHVKYKTSLFSIVALVGLVLLIVIIIGIVATS